MVKYNEVYYYSCNEISNGFNNESDDFKKLKLKFCKVYKKCPDYDFYCSYIQEKLYPAAKKKLLKHIEYTKKTSDKIYYAFSIDDINHFLDLPEAKNIMFKTENIKNITVVDAVI